MHSLTTPPVPFGTIHKFCNYMHSCVAHAATPDMPDLIRARESWTQQAHQDLPPGPQHACLHGLACQRGCGA